MTRQPVVNAILSAAFALAVLPAAPAAAQTTLSPEEQQIADWVDAHVDEATGLLERIVDINSGTMNFQGVRMVGDVLRSQLDSLGFQTRWIDMPAEVNRAGHLFAERWQGSNGRSMLLIGHLDTVFEKDDPFQRFLRQDSIAHGPGASDMKGGDVAILYALKALQAVGALHHTRIIVAFTGDEEAPGQPLSVDRGDLIQAGKKADVALGFEGAVRMGGQEYGTIARRSSSEWELTVHGRQSHSAGIFGPGVGAGAIFEASRILHQFYDEVRGEQYLTFNAGVILGGTDVQYDEAEHRGTAFGKTNVVPNTVIVDGGIRTISDEQLQRARQKMRDIVAHNLPVTSADIAFTDGYPSMPPTDANRALLQTYSDISQALGTGPMKTLDPSQRGAADISFVAPYVDAALAGMGVYGSGSHGPHEIIDLRSFPLTIKRAAIMIYRLSR
ncbi:MAG TPA: M20/M25/M40 family metallo-hydrolase [Longimicrobiales bacterium]|nr:M20/M25/M40 family metallo-hydrolase [Longimicrobiales bacterium]